MKDKTEVLEKPESAPDDSGAVIDDLNSIDVDDSGDFAPEPSDVAEKKPDVSTGEVLNMALTPIVKILAPNWDITPEEIKMLSDVYGELLDKYFPDLDMGIELTAIICTGMVVTPRMGKPLRIKKEPEGGADGDKSEHSASE